MTALFPLEVIDIVLVEHSADHSIVDLIASCRVGLGAEVTVPILTAEILILLIDGIVYQLVVVHSLSIDISGIEVEVSCPIPDDEPSQVVYLLACAHMLTIHSLAGHLLVPGVDLVCEVGSVDSSIGLSGDPKFVREVLWETIVEISYGREGVH